MNYKFLLTLFLTGNLISFAQNYTRSDSLQGGLRHERIAYDVLKYDLDVKVFPKTRTIKGVNKILFEIIEDRTKNIQIDLFENMVVDSILWKGLPLDYTREFNAVFVDFPESLSKENVHEVDFYYSGKPLIAKRPPWDGGFIWKKDSNKNDWIGVAVQGTGASLWYPVKDHQTDEPDYGAIISITAPNNLMGVSNGQLISKTELPDNQIKWEWEVKNPINNYNITLNVGDYVHFGENYNGLKLDYYVLRDNLKKAQKHFREVKPMLDCFQEKFGKYPFWKDGYKLVETPYLGMEHQSAIAYGNQYEKGYLGQDISNTGIGLLFDYITIHESGHEWFGNSITSADIADMWIHEGFATYCESVFIECQYGYEKSATYMSGKKRNILNQKPIIGQFGVNFKADNSDMYSKGALLLHTIRSIINNDQLWWDLLLDYSQTYKHSIIDTPTVVAFFTKKSGINLNPIFNQYLQHKNLPILQVKIKRKKIHYRWQTDASNFVMPIEIEYKDLSQRWEATNEWKNSDIKANNLEEFYILDKRFYINLEKVKE